MGRSLLRVLRISLVVVLWWSPFLADASSRQRSLPVEQSFKLKVHGVNSEDFFLRFIKAMYDQQNKPQFLSEDQQFLEWVPDGSLLSPVPPECLPETLEKKLDGAGGKARSFANVVQKFFNSCEGALGRKATGGLMGLIDFAMARYSILENSKIKNFEWTSPLGRKLRGFIGIRDQKPRPWVIFKCGVFCAAEADGASIKNYVIHLFDQTPFNVVVLGNRTGEDFIRENGVFHLGGYFESQDFLDVAQWLRFQSPYKSLVSSVHLVGVSLGGNAAALAERRLSQRDHQYRPWIQSITSICGVADLRPTVENMYGDSIKGFIFSRLTWDSLLAVKTDLPEALDLIEEGSPDAADFPNLLSRLVGRYMEPLPSLLPARAELSEKEKIFWEQSQYSRQSPSVAVPTLVWSSRDDSVVDYEINAGHLKQVREAHPDENIGVVGVDHGNHCGFGTAYGYSVTSAVIRNFILKNSPEYQEELRPLHRPLSLKLAPLGEGERIVSHWWSLSDSAPYSPLLNFEIYGADDSLCPEELQYESEGYCQRTVKVGLSEEVTAELGVRWPASLTEKEALVRELNARTTLFSGPEISVGAKTWPDQIVFKYQ